MALLLKTNGVDTATSEGLVLGSPDVRLADPFTAASFTALDEIVASTPEAWVGVYLMSVSDGPGIVSLFTGSAGSEVRIASVPAENSLQFRNGFGMFIPVPIASGTRLSVGGSYQTTTAGAHKVQVIGVPSSGFDSDPPYTRLDFGAFNLENSSSTYGTFPVVDPGGTANTKGSWTELSQTGTNGANNVLNGDSIADYVRLGILIGQEDTFQTDQNQLVDFAQGAEGLEDPAVENVAQVVSVSELNMPTQNHILWMDWGQGASIRLSARAQSSITDASDRLVRVGVCGLVI